jgi:hypothetical protein
MGGNKDATPTMRAWILCAADFPSYAFWPERSYDFAPNCGHRAVFCVRPYDQSVAIWSACAFIENASH